MKKLAVLASVASFPLMAFAALININTADIATLETLPGIGAVKAQAIIDYRTEYGPFAALEDIENVSGIGPATFANIEAFITVDEAPPPPVSDTGASATSTDRAATSTPAASSTPRTGGAPEYAPLPALRITATVPDTVAARADTAYSATVYDRTGALRPDAVISWSFGDGMERTGDSVLHAFYAPGEYFLVVHATSADGGDAYASFTITAEDASISLTSISSRGIALTNNAPHAVDLSSWRLATGGKEFRFPENTLILPKHTVTFAPEVTELPSASSAELRYPSGAVAASYPLQSASQAPKPPARTVSYNQMQTVEPVTGSNAIPAHDIQAVGAPTAQAALAAAGAAVSSSSATSVSPRHSAAPWVAGFMGLLVFSGGALLLL